MIKILDLRFLCDTAMRAMIAEMYEGMKLLLILN